MKQECSDFLYDLASVLIIVWFIVWCGVGIALIHYLIMM